MPDNRFPKTVPGFDHPTEGDGAPSTANLPATGSGGEGTQAQTGVPSIMRPPGGPPLVPGYAVSREIARGGMGVVYAAHDPVFDREVAVKVMNPGQGIGRFVIESKVTARLPHPGVPPVYALGQLDDGRPFLAMKLIEGHTLAAELKHADRPDLPRLLDIFHHICLTVGFAHSRGIIHRDLKPGNVMVGSFGEVLVMDWGLAKSVVRSQGSGDSEDTDPLPESRRRSPEADEETQAGEVKGTPAYMAPEQARGEPVDARADVFALGGILAAILTGNPPFVGDTAVATVLKAARADLGECFDELDDCGADPELVAIAKKCLAPRPADRYPTGAELVAAVAAYRAGVEERLRRAERERAAAEARTAEQRKRRKVQLALAASVMLLACGGGAFAWYRDHQEAERKLDAERAAAERKATEARVAAERAFVAQQAREGIATNLALAAELRKQLRFKPAEAVLARAAELARSAPELLPKVQQAQADLAFVAQLDDIRYRKWVVLAKAGGHADFNTRSAPPEYRAAFAARGLDLPTLDPSDAVARIAASDVRPELVAAVDDWALYEPDAVLRNRLLGLVRRLDPGAWTDRLRTPANWADRAEMAKLAAEADPARVAPALLSALATLMARNQLDPTALLQAARAKHPTEFEFAFALGRWQTVTSTDGRQVGPYEAARALRPDNPAVWNNLGDALRLRGEWDAAAAAHQRAIDLDPRAGTFRSNLGMVLNDKGDLDGALAAYRGALKHDPALGHTWNNLGVVLARKGAPAEAIEAYKKAAELEPRAAAIYSNWGNALRALRDFDGAVAKHARAVEIEPNLASTRFNLGVALRDKGDLDGAIGAYRKAIEIDPRFARAHSSLGNALHDKRDLKGAIAAYRRSIALDPNYARAHANLGNALRDKGDLEEAVVALERAIELDPTFADAHYNLGLALQLRQNHKGAIAEYRKAIELKPRDAEAHSNLAAALSAVGETEAAVAEYRIAVALAPQLTQAHLGLGLALRARGDPNGARAALQTAARLDPKGQAIFANLGEVLLDKNDLDGAIAAFKRALELDPKDLQSTNNLGIALRGKRDFAGAVALFERAIELAPRAPHGHVNLGATLHLKGDLNGAVAAYERALELDPNAAQPHYNLATVYLQQKKFAAGVASARAAIRADPQYAIAHALLGHLLQQTGDLTGARAALTEAARIDKRWAATLAALPPPPVAPAPREVKAP